MDSKESIVTEVSEGGNSDSELSEGWNIIDQVDVSNDIPVDASSSDGESIEIIDAEADSKENGTETDLLKPAKDGAFQLAKPEHSAVITGHTDLSESVVSPVNIDLPVHEEMFDSSFCWFLFFAATTMLASSFVSMALENALSWDMDAKTESPSFLRDLSTTPKPFQDSDHDNLGSWFNHEAATVEPLRENKNDKDFSSNKFNEIKKKSKIYRKDYNSQYSSSEEKDNLKTVDLKEMGSHIKALNEITGSSIAQYNFAEASSILDTLHSRLSKLQEMATENSKLHDVLKDQKYSLSRSLKEIEFLISMSLEKLATDLLNNMKKVERKFKTHCETLERQGYETEQTGVFDECEEIEKRNEFSFESQAEHSNGFENTQNYQASIENEQFNSNNYFYGSRGSTGKEYSTSQNYDEYLNNKENKFSKNNNEFKDSYSTMEGRRPYKDTNKNKMFGDTKSDKNYYKKVKHYTQQENRKFKKDYNKEESSKSKKRESKQQFFNDKFDKKFRNFGRNKMYHSKEDKPTNNVYKDYESMEDQYGMENIEEVIVKYLEENCNNNYKFVKSGALYENFKNVVDEKGRIPKKLFYTLQEKHCKKSHKTPHTYKTYNKEHLKGDFSGKNKEKFNSFKDETVTQFINKNKESVVEVTILEDKTESSSQIDLSPSDNIVIPSDKSRQWVFSYQKNADKENNTELSGDWYIKAGDSRSKTRWSNHRSDWYFDRASYRRRHPHSPNWFPVRHKNWFFRRAWAREQCRQNSRKWCHMSPDETITISNPDFNFR